MSELAVLVRDAGSGDQGAWSALVERYSGLVWNVARSYRLGHADAADVAQTVWLRLVESLPRLREPEAVAGWLATTTRNESLRTIRRAGRETPNETIDLVDRPTDDAHSPEAIVELGEQRQLVATALDRLSQRCRTLLRVLAYTPDRSYAEVSEALGMPVGSIGPTRGRCLERLRRELVIDGALPAGEGSL